MVAASEDNIRDYVYLQSNGVEYTLLSLILMIALVYLIFFIRKFELTKILGLIFIVMYGFFITFAVLIEVDILFPYGNFC